MLTLSEEKELERLKRELVQEGRADLLEDTSEVDRLKSELKDEGRDDLLMEIETGKRPNIFSEFKRFAPNLAANAERAVSNVRNVTKAVSGQTKGNFVQKTLKAAIPPLLPPVPASPIEGLEEAGTKVKRVAKESLERAVVGEPGTPFPPPTTKMGHAVGAALGTVGSTAIDIAPFTPTEFAIQAPIASAVAEGIGKAGMSEVESILDDLATNFRLPGKMVTTSELKGIRPVRATETVFKPAVFENKKFKPSDEFIQEMDFAKREGRDIGRTHWGTILDTPRVTETIDGSTIGITKKELINPLDDAEFKTKTDYKQEMDNLLNKYPWLKERIRYKATKRIVKKSVTGKTPKELDDPLLDIKYFGEKKISFEDLTKRHGNEKATQIKEVAEYMRSRYDIQLDTMNKMLEGLNLKPVVKKENYFTHSENLVLFDDLFGLANSHNLEKDISKFLKPSKVAFRFRKQRVLEEERFNPIDALDGFEMYSKAFYKSLNLTPQVVKMRAYAKHMPENAGKYFNDLADALSGKPVPADDFVTKLHPSIPKIASSLRRRFVQNIIPGSVIVSLVQLSSLPLIIPLTGFSAFGKGAIKLMLPSYRRFVRENSRILRGRNLDIDLSYRDMDSGRKILTYAIKKFDEISVSQNFLTGIEHAKKLGLSPDDAVIYADGLAGKTQGTLQEWARNPLLRSRVMNAILPLAQFGTNFSNYFYRDLRYNKPAMEAAKNYIEYFTIISAVNYSYEKAGLPAPYQLSEHVPVVGRPLRFAEYSKSGVPGIAAAPADIAQSLTKGDIKGAGKAALKTGFQFLPKYGGEFIRKLFTGKLLPRKEKKK